MRWTFHDENDGHDLTGMMRMIEVSAYAMVTTKTTLSDFIREEEVHGINRTAGWVQSISNRFRLIQIQNCKPKYNILTKIAPEFELMLDCRRSRRLQSFNSDATRQKVPDHTSLVRENLQRKKRQPKREMYI